MQVKIKGPAAADLALNFVLRWNTEAAKAVRAPDGTILTTCSTPPLKAPDSSTILPEKSGGCGVQVLRSASRNMCIKEYDFLAPKDQKRFRKPLAAQANIATAMETLISKAEHFIYIENQFFISAFGEPDIPATKDDLVGPARQIKEDFGWLKRDATRIMPGDADDPPENRICALLAKRIDETIFAEHPFHVYITLPVHPEGGLNTAIIANQVHWTMQTLTNGSCSLLNRIRRSLLAKKLKDNNDPDWARAYKLDIKKAELAFKENGIEFKQCFDYVTLLNLRNWRKLDSDKGVRYVTEQIYPHNKMMIVDDRYVLLGTANINDRSLLGYRDSEINVLIKDTKTGQADLCGDGTKRLVRNFARQLRMEVWNKIFGITAGGDRAATALKDAVDKPGAKASWKKIQEIAEANTELYEAAFDFIPRNDNIWGVLKDGKPIAASIWPLWDPSIDNGKGKATGGLWYPMPFDPKFWDEKRFNEKAAAKLDGVKGFITLLPYKWTQGENNNIGLHTHTVAVNTVTPPQQDAVRMAENAPALERNA